ncbi:Protein of unknown function [Pyronema omphalodes CBS 100304]|uniref:C2H2-type domain-containing protein n=1 Tax=Pyronema omphalodes (strain CBS 100304) TaxID=1076935 RepID=U4LI01_PYROM|nr:Protein of unknown function [Pyronema omphalodes CBS 100304]
MSGEINPDDTEAIRQQYYDHHLTQPTLPMEALQADTPRDVYVGGFTYYEAPAPMENLNETYRRLLATPGQNQWPPYALNDGPPDVAVDAMTRNAQLYWDTGGYQNFDSQPLQDLPGRVYIKVDDVPPNSTHASTQATPKHRSTHEGKMLKCPKCNKGYARKDTLLRHLIKLHEMDRESAKFIAEEIDKSVYA